MLVIGGAIVAFRSDDGARHVTAAGTSTPSIGAPPAPALGDVTVRVPAGWHETHAPMVPGLTDPREVLTAATFPLSPPATPSAECDNQFPTSVLDGIGPTDAVVWILHSHGVNGVAPRPARFDWTTGLEWPCTLRAGLRARWIRFADGDQLVYAAVVAGDRATDATQAQAFGILDSLQVAPIGDAGSTSSSSQPSATVHPDDAVRAVALAWLDRQPRDTVDAYVEDFASIRDAIRAGMAQHSSAQLAAYSGRVGTVRMTSERQRRSTTTC